MAAIRSRVDWIIDLVDPVANGRDQDEGQRLIQMYRNMGLHRSATDNAVEAGIQSLSQRMQDAARCLVNGIGRMRPKPELSRMPANAALDPLAS